MDRITLKYTPSTLSFNSPIWYRKNTRPLALYKTFTYCLVTLEHLSYGV